jgi:hypothetical protein
MQGKHTNMKKKTKQQQIISALGLKRAQTTVQVARKTGLKVGTVGSVLYAAVKLGQAEILDYNGPGKSTRYRLSPAGLAARLRTSSRVPRSDRVLATFESEVIRDMLPPIESLVSTPEVELQPQTGNYIIMTPTDKQVLVSIDGSGFLTVKFEDGTTVALERAIVRALARIVGC